jgi:DNA-binding response OmpR family regulator
MKTNPSSKRHVLIAEDDVDIGNLLQYLLQRGGYRTTAVVDGRAALNKAFELKPDLLLLDLMLPNLHGFEVCRLLKATPSLCHTPVIMLTALTSEENRIRGFRVGANDYVTKPFHSNDLMRRVDRVVGGHEKPELGSSLPRITFRGKIHFIDLEDGSLRPVGDALDRVSFEDLDDRTVRQVTTALMKPTFTARTTRPSGSNSKTSSRDQRVAGSVK